MLKAGFFLAMGLQPGAYLATIILKIRQLGPTLLVKFWVLNNYKAFLVPAVPAVQKS